MTEYLKVYVNDNFFTKAERNEDGIFKVEISRLKLNTDYPKGALKVSIENENGESEKVDVPAFKTDVQRVDYIVLNSSLLTMEEGATKRLNVSTYPSEIENLEIIYTSSDEEVATVTNKGTVKAISKGTATITVTVDGRHSDTAYVTVEKAKNTES